MEDLGITRPATRSFKMTTCGLGSEVLEAGSVRCSGDIQAVGKLLKVVT